MNKKCLIILILSLLLNLSGSIEDNKYKAFVDGVYEIDGIKYRVIEFGKKFDEIYEIDMTPYSQLIGMVRKEVIDKSIRKVPSFKKRDILEVLIGMSKAKDEFELNDVESAYLAFRWIAQNIEYESIEGNQDLTNVFNSRKGNSAGISSLFNRMCTYMKVESDSITGNFKSIVQNYNYTWNYITINGSYYLIDVSMATEFDNKKYEIDFYFGMNPEFFIRYYFPKESKWQLLLKPYTKDKFDSMAYLYKTFYMFGFKTIYPDTTEISENQKIILTYNESIPIESISCVFADSNFDLIGGEHFNFSNGKAEINPNLNNETAAYLYLFSRIKNAGYTSSIAIYKINHSKKSNAAFNLKSKFLSLLDNKNYNYFIPKALKRFENKKSKNIRGKMIN